MKTSVKILIVAALAVAVVAAVSLKKSKSPAVVTGGPPAEAALAAETAGSNTVASAKMPKLLDLGAGKCIPCKMMAPILERCAP